MFYLETMLQSKIAANHKKGANGFASPLASGGITMRRLRKAQKFLTCALVMLFVFAVPASASSSDPVQMIDNLKEYLFDAIGAIGLILVGVGVVQIGMSFKSQDPSQRAVGLLCTFGGIIIAGVRAVVDAMG